MLQGARTEATRMVIDIENNNIRQLIMTTILAIKKNLLPLCHVKRSANSLADQLAKEGARRQNLIQASKRDDGSGWLTPLTSLAFNLSFSLLFFTCHKLDCVQ